MYYFSFRCPYDTAKQLLSKIPYSTSFCGFSFDHDRWYFIAENESDIKEISESGYELVDSVEDIIKEDVVALNPLKTMVEPLTMSGNEDLLPWYGYV